MIEETIPGLVWNNDQSREWNIQNQRKQCEDAGFSFNSNWEGPWCFRPKYYDLENNMAVLKTKFIYQMYNIAAMDVMEQSYNMDNVINTPRKGIYSNEDRGFKTFNNG